VPLYDFTCGTCDRTYEAHVPLADFPACAPCPTCGTADHVEKVFLPPRTCHALPDATVVYRAPDGSMRYPGEPGGTSCAKYERMGYQRLEIRGAAEMRRFEQRMNQQEYSAMCRRVERQEALREQGESVRRSDLRSRMSAMSPRARDFARAAMRHNDHKPRQHARDPGFHSEVYNMDRSNREASRDGRGQRHRD
jgi:putative FmdB family regulatory protein